MPQTTEQNFAQLQIDQRSKALTLLLHGDGFKAQEQAAAPVTDQRQPPRRVVRR